MGHGHNFWPGGPEQAISVKTAAAQRQALTVGLWNEVSKLVPQPQTEKAQEKTKQRGDKEWTSARLDIVAR